MKYRYEPISEQAIREAVTYIKEQKRKIELLRILCGILSASWLGLVVRLWTS